MLDAAVWKKEPFGYRLTSVLLHALNAALLFVFATMALRWKTNGRDERLARPSTIERARGPHAPTIIFAAAFGALVFALHPLVVKAVAEPSNREDLLVLLPLLVGLIGILWPIRSPWSLNALFIVCSFLAVLAKESGMAVPFIFAATCWFFRRGDLRSLVPGLIGSLSASLGFLFASYVWRPEDSAILAQTPGPLAMRAICEWQTGNRGAAIRSLGEAKRLSGLYDSASPLQRALIWSPFQLADLKTTASAVGD